MEKDKVLTGCEPYLEEQKCNPDLKAIKVSLDKFLAYYKDKGKDISEYQSADFEDFYKTDCDRANTITARKKHLRAYFEYLELEDVVMKLRAAQRTNKPNYIRTFEELDAEIELVRLKEFPSYAGVPFEKRECDTLTVGQVVIYLAWLGIPQNWLPNIPLDAIDLENQWIDAGKKFSFKGNEKILKFFEKYKSVEKFNSKIVRNGKLYFQSNNFYGDCIIRTRVQPKPGSTKNIDGIANRTFTPYSFKYLKVYFSGIFARGYARYLNGEKPNFGSSKDIWDYFQAVVETETSRRALSDEWDNYVKWRESE